MDVTALTSRVLTPSELLQNFESVRSRTEQLAQPLSAEDACIQSMDDASPTKWHLAHSSWFFETFILKQFSTGYREFDPTFNYLFNSYYNSIGERHARPKRGMLSRPSLAEVLSYRKHVTEHVLAMNLDERIILLLELGINHEQQHQELILTDIKHVLAQNPIRPQYRERLLPRGVAASNEWIAIEEGLYEIGHAGSIFAFDNESPRHRVYLNKCSLRNSLVTNREYLAFMQAGGYDDPLLWLSAGSNAVQLHGWKSPLYWEEHNGTWYTFTVSGLVELDLDHPVTHISFYEAEAFARWAGYRLPAEAEMEIASSLYALEGSFADRDLFHPVDANGVTGEVWQWTASDYNAYPGYKPAAGAVGEYNGKFMSNQMVLRGGSCATPRDHYRATYRNFFPHDARWQFSGIRLAK